VVSPNGGDIDGAQDVSLSVTTPGAQIYYTTDGTEPTDQAPSILYAGVPFNVSGTTVVKARAYRSGFVPSPVVAVTFQDMSELTPSALSGLQLWVHGGAGLPASSYVDRWSDQSGNGNDLVQSNGLNTPAVIPDAQNGLPVVRFDGTDDFLSFTRIGTIRTVFWVLRDASTETGVRFLLGDSGYNYFSGGEDSLWHANVHGYVRNGSTWLNGVAVDGTQTQRPQQMSIVSLVTTGNVIADRFSQNGANVGTSWNGDLAELIIYDRVLTDPEREDVENYLNERYCFWLSEPTCSAVP
jgi:hypothetical protein